MMMVIKATMDAFRAVRVRSFSLRPAVMVMKTGMVLSGLISVKNEVKHKSPKERASFMVQFLVTSEKGDFIWPLKVGKF
jgi:hypothetical protein